MATPIEELGTLILEATQIRENITQEKMEVYLAVRQIGSMIERVRNIERPEPADSGWNTLHMRAKREIQDTLKALSGLLVTYLDEPGEPEESKHLCQVNSIRPKKKAKELEGGEIYWETNRNLAVEVVAGPRHLKWNFSAIIGRRLVTLHDAWEIPQHPAVEAHLAALEGEDASYTYVSRLDHACLEMHVSPRKDVWGRTSGVLGVGVKVERRDDSIPVVIGIRPELLGVEEPAYQYHRPEAVNQQTLTPLEMEDLLDFLKNEQSLQGSPLLHRFLGVLSRVLHAGACVDSDQL